jgi:hypothetical protein
MKTKQKKVIKQRVVKKNKRGMKVEKIKGEGIGKKLKKKGEWG